MNKKYLQLFCCIVLSIVFISPLSAQHKIGFNLAPTIRFLEASNTVFQEVNYFSISGGIRYENRINSFLFLELGADVTYYSAQKKVSNTFGFCANCNVAIPFFNIGQEIEFIEIDFPILPRIKLLEKNHSLLTVYTGYSPSWKLPFLLKYYYPAGQNHYKEEIPIPITFFHTIHFGLQYQYIINQRLTLGVSPSFRHRKFEDDVNENQYRLDFKLLYQLGARG